MEEVYYIAAIVAFALAACSFVACIVIFVRAGVPDAIRFLRHRPVKGGRGGVVVPKAAPARPGRRKRNSPSTPPPDDRLTSPVDADAETTEIGTTDELSERPTGMLEEEPSEQPTGMLGFEPSEQPTGLLESEPSERPTGLLEDDAERPTELLDDEPAERPTDVLEEPPSPQNAAHAAVSAVAQQDEPSFRFILKHNEVVVHTQERIA